MKRLLTLLLAAATVLMAVPAFATIAGSPHDFAGVSGYARCEVCHVPHAAGGAKRLWRVAPTGSLTGWAGTNVGTLCYGCHGDGYLIGTAANADGVPAHTWAADAGPFKDTSHGRTVATLSASFGGTIDSSKPYTSSAMECTSCHNVHFDGSYSADSAKRPFLRMKSGDTSTSDFCADCHGDRKTAFVEGSPSSDNHPVLMPYYAVGSINRSMIQAVTAMNTPVTTTAWSLGGKFDKAGGETSTQTATTTDNVGCQSCHSIHMAAPAVDSTGAALTGARQLLAVTYADSAVCMGCHNNTVAAGNVGRAAGDHPYGKDLNNFAYMSLNGNLWLGGGGITATDKGSATLHGGAICTSCHKAHQPVGGTGITNLRRHGAETSATDTQGWCTSCHGSVAPTGHHSNINNYANSAINCSDCHTAAAGNDYHAHNGFVYAITNNDDSFLCMGCHTGLNTARDPVNHLVGQSWPAYGGGAFQSIPSYNLGSGYGANDLSGNNYASHYLGPWGTETAGGTSQSTNPKTTAWTSDSSAVSKYGTDGKKMICESCHSILHNIGTGSGATASSGYMANLLLQAYVDDDTTASGGGGGTGSAFCVSCHNRGMSLGAGAVASDTDVEDPAKVPAGTHPMTNWTITRAVDAGRGTTTLITGSGSYANAATPLTYPGTDKMDCDSCHKPHMANINGTFDPSMSDLGSVSVILENAGPGAGVYTNLCQNCHAEGL